MRSESNSLHRAARIAAEEIWHTHFRLIFETLTIEDGSDFSAPAGMDGPHITLPTRCDKARFISQVAGEILLRANSAEQVRERAGDLRCHRIKVEEGPVRATFRLVPGGCWDTEESEFEDSGTVYYPFLEGR